MYALVFGMHIYITQYIQMDMYICIYIYESEDTHILLMWVIYVGIYVYISIYVCMQVYIYIVHLFV